MHPPVALISSTIAHAWSTAPDDPEAAAHWHAFLEDDHTACVALAASFRAADEGNGRLRQWALTVQSAKDVASQLPLPPQGRIRIDPALLWALMPEAFVPAPLPYTAPMLVSIPPQRRPPGYIPRHITDAVRPWAYDLITNFATSEAERAIWAFEHRPHDPLGKLGDEWLMDAPRAPEYLVLGPEAFHDIPHADGVGSWNASFLTYEVDANGWLTLFDWSVGFRTWWDVDELMHMLQVDTFQELLSHVFGGSILKATCPRQHRMGPNLRSYHLRAREIADDLDDLIKGGHYKVRPLRWLDEPSALPMCPVGYLPQWSQPVGGTDKPGKPQEKRRLSDGSAPRDVYVRTRPTGPPAGELATDFNTLSGPMRPREGDVLVDGYVGAHTVRLSLRLLWARACHRLQPRPAPVVGRPRSAGAAPSCDTGRLWSRSSGSRSTSIRSARSIEHPVAWGTLAESCAIHAD